jgi:hypothetical protein
MRDRGFRTERYLISKIPDIGTAFSKVSLISENLSSCKFTPAKISKNPSCVVNDFIDLMNGNAVKFENIALWNGSTKVQSLGVELLDEKNMLLRVKINLEYYVISSKFEKKILKFNKLVDLPRIEITFCSAESLGVLLLLHALSRGDGAAIKVAEASLRLEWMPSFEYAWTHLARETNYHTKLKNN